MSYSYAAAGSLRRAVPAAVLPPDWPGPGPIDLSLHDFAHASSMLESWYVSARLRTATGCELSLQATFLRQAGNHAAASGRAAWRHSASWSLRDPTRWGESSRPVPDQEGNHTPQIFPASGSRILAFNKAGNLLSKTVEHTYQLDLQDKVSGSACALTLIPQQPALRCRDGIVRNGDEIMFYYYVPRCRVTGHVVVDGASQRVLDGLAWYDHEFGGLPRQGPALRPQTVRKSY
jgi:predicted secreted hydrolase